MTVHEALAWLLTVGLAVASSALTGATIKAAEDGLHWVVTRPQKQLISYVWPFLIVAVAYPAQVGLGYAAWNIDTAFAYVLHAGTVAFGAQVTYWGWQSVKGALAAPTDGSPPPAPPRG